MQGISRADVCSVLPSWTKCVENKLQYVWTAHNIQKNSTVEFSALNCFVRYEEIDVCVCVLVIYVLWTGLPDIYGKSIPVN